MSSIPPHLPVHVTQPQTSPLAIVSLVFGLLGWTLLPFLGCIVAIICGHLARSEIRRDPLRLGGDGLAIAGLILGWLGVVLGILVVAAFLMFFGGLLWLASL